MHSGQFLQSFDWQKFQKSLGRKTWRIDDALIIKMPLKFGLSYLYSPKISEIRIQNLEIRIREIAKKEKAIFWRIEPQTKLPENFIQTKDVQPKCTQILDLTKSEDKLLADMHQKTRYNLRLAERKKLQITNYKLLITDKEFSDFYNLLKITARRQKIKLHPEDYYRKLAKFNKIFVAYHEDKPIAGAMINFHDDTVTYLHGGSDEKYKNLMAPYLLHWKIIKTAKTRGMKFYDWWGVDEKKWPGLTRFKKGFGGQELCAPGAFDLPIDKLWYFVYKLIRK